MSYTISEEDLQLLQECCMILDGEFLGVNWCLPFVSVLSEPEIKQRAVSTFICTLERIRAQRNIVEHNPGSEPDQSSGGINEQNQSQSEG